jgi:DNA-binding FadR family transcriptional regulator
MTGRSSIGRPAVVSRSRKDSAALQKPSKKPARRATVRNTPRAADNALAEPATEYADGGRVHGRVVRALGTIILGRKFQPGEVLPKEDDLARQFKVSRTSVREAVKVLSAKGLLESRPRLGVRIRPLEDWHFLDPVVLSWHPDLTGDRDLMQSLIEARRIIEPPAAGMAAKRATAADLAAIEAGYMRLERAIPRDPVACHEADVEFHRAVISASHNVVLKGLVGTIEAALRAVFLVTNRLMDRESPSLAAHWEVLDRIRLRDASGAAAAMNHLLDIAAGDLGSPKMK